MRVDSYRSLRGAGHPNSMFDSFTLCFVFGCSIWQKLAKTTRCFHRPSSPAFSTLCFHFCAPHGRCVLPSPLLEPFRRPSWTGWPGMPMRLCCGGRHFCWQAELPTAWRFVSGPRVAGGDGWKNQGMNDKS